MKERTKLERLVERVLRHSTPPFASGDVAVLQRYSSHKARKFSPLRGACEFLAVASAATINSGTEARQNGWQPSCSVAESAHAHAPGPASHLLRRLLNRKACSVWMPLTVNQYLDFGKRK
jgi:hypothetical protein